MKKQPIFLGRMSGFPDYWIIYTYRTQYRFEPQDPLFKYENYINVTRKVTRKEAEKIMELIPSGRGLCGGDCVEIFEL